MNRSLAKILVGAIGGAFILAILFPLQMFATENGPNAAVEQVRERGIVPCKGVDDPSTPENEECNYGALIRGINTVVQYFLYLATFIAVAMLAWGGFQYLMAAGNPSKKTDAKRMITTVLIGILIVYSAWLIVYVILSNLLIDPRIDNPLT